MRGGEKITLKCKSYDDDLGFRTLYPGQFFEWSFRVSVIGETRFYCDLRWKEYLVSFDAWNSSETCKNCVWEATNDIVIGPQRFLHWEKPVLDFDNVII